MGGWLGCGASCPARWVDSARVPVYDDKPTGDEIQIYSARRSDQVVHKKVRSLRFGKDWSKVRTAAEAAAVARVAILAAAP